MQLGQLITGWPIRLHVGDPSTAIADVADDSRLVATGTLFVARTGTQTSGRRFIADAIQRGAAAILSDAPIELPPGVPLILCEDPAAVAIQIALKLHGDPAKKLKLIGVTGTNGKTTTAYMIRHLLAAVGRKCGLLGTVEIDDGATREAAQLTTPGGLQLISLFARMVANGCDSCVMEVSSHALDQGRVATLNFAVGLFSNLTGDHLDYHKTMDNYAAAKAKLFESLAPGALAAVNAEDAAADRMVRDCKARVLRFGFFAPGKKLDVSAEVLSATSRGAECIFRGPWGEVAATLPLIGAHNVSNMLAAICGAYGVGADISKLGDAIAACPQVPGRLERVVLADRPAPPFEVLVDYAHTDDALANVLRALRPLTRGKLRVLFGCGGDRDATKRPRMAKTATALADRIVITSDNPRTEEPQDILRQIVAGVAKGDMNRVSVEPDRARAISQIIRDAKPGDIILLAGKGHEDYQIIGTTKHPFDDRLVAADVMKSLQNAAARSAAIAAAGAQQQ